MAPGSSLTLDKKSRVNVVVGHGWGGGMGRRSPGDKTFPLSGALARGMREPGRRRRKGGLAGGATLSHPLPSRGAGVSSAQAHEDAARFPPFAPQGARFFASRPPEGAEGALARRYGPDLPLSAAPAMAESLPLPGLSLREEPLPGPGAAEGEAELSLSLARTKTRSYGSTATVVAPLAERYVEHRLSPGDTLPGLALKYGVTVSREGGGLAQETLEATAWAPRMWPVGSRAVRPGGRVSVLEDSPPPPRARTQDPLPPSAWAKGAPNTRKDTGSPPTHTHVYGQRALPPP